MATKVVSYLPCKKRLKTDNIGTDHLSHSHPPQDPTTITNLLRRPTCPLTLSHNRLTPSSTLNIQFISISIQKVFKDVLVNFRNFDIYLVYSFHMVQQ
jgi:hypothetical protein